MSDRIRRHVLIESTVAAELDEHLAIKRESSLSAEVNVTLKEYLRRQKAGREDILLAPVMERLINEKIEQQEIWLRAGVWAGATYSATTTLLLLELLCGQTVDPKDAKAHLDLIRGRAWKRVRKGQDSGQEA